MKKKYSLNFCILLLLVALCGCDSRTEDVKIMHNTVENVVKTLENRYQIQKMGFGEGGDKKFYKSISLSFIVLRVLSKNEGRKMLIRCAEELLKAINSNEQLLPYLLPSPFSITNIEMTLFIYHPDGKEALYPNISIFTVRNGKVMYKTDTPELKNKYGYFTEEEESYDEAVKIVQSQLQGSN